MKSIKRNPLSLRRLPTRTKTMKKLRIQLPSNLTTRLRITKILKLILSQNLLIKRAKVTKMLNRSVSSKTLC